MNKMRHEKDHQLCPLTVVYGRLNIRLKRGTKTERQIELFKFSLPCWSKKIFVNAVIKAISSGMLLEKNT